MMVSEILIFQFSLTFWAYLHIVYEIYALGNVAVHLANAEVNALIFRSNTAGNEVVGI